MNTTTSTARTAFPRALYVGGHYGYAQGQAPAALDCDLVTFDKLSAICPGPMHDGEYRLLANLVERAAHTPRYPKTYRKHRDADDKVAVS
jgi:hypothetical protein